jgi:hypothetical protein
VTEPPARFSSQSSNACQPFTVATLRTRKASAQRIPTANRVSASVPPTAKYYSSVTGAARQKKITAAPGIAMKDLFIANGDAARSIQPVKVVATYDFHHATGVLIYQVVRYEPKHLVSGGWMVTADGLAI